MKKLIVFTFLCSILLPRELFLDTHEALSVKSTQNSHISNIGNENNLVERTTREDIILFNWDFEATDSLWNNDAGWELTESDYNSETHSYNSPNTVENQNSVWNVVSPTVTMPALGDGEIMRFKFALTGDMPDTDGDNDGYLEDYYQLAIMDLEALSWHASANAPDADGNAYWCADEAIGPDGGYLDEWMQYLDTPALTLGDNGMVSAKLKWVIEDWQGAVVGGSCTDGWDSANVRISTDGGVTWDLLEDPNMPYHFDCGYGWIYNDGEYETGGSLNHLAPGWGSTSFHSEFVDFSANLSAYAGQEVIVRFAFGSDPAYNTFDQPDMTGFEVDNIVIEDDGGVIYNDDADDSANNNTMIPSGEVWEAQFYDYLSCTDARPGACGSWEWYEPGLAFNGNVLHDISHLAGKDVIIKFSCRYDDNDDGGSGTGLFIDDFIVYKESSGNFPPPGNLTAEAGDEEAHLQWQDMNISGDFDYDWTNMEDGYMYSIYMESGFGYAGQKFDVAGEATINSMQVYSSMSAAATTNILGFSKQGALFNSSPDYTEYNVELQPGWNTIDLSALGWTFNNGFILAYEFTGQDVFMATLDDTAVPSSNSMVSFGGGSWGSWSESASDGGLSDGEWAIRANVTLAGANVTYNVQRDGVQVASGLDTYMHTDGGLVNNSVYTYTVSATYSDGTESDPSESVEVTPQAQTVHQESYDDGTADTGWNPDGSGQFAAVRFAAHDMGEQLIRFHWYQEGDGGAFYIKVWEDDNGLPGTEVLSVVQVAGNVDGWNVRDLVSENLDVTCDFWIGMKRFSSSMPIGVDTDSSSGNSYSSDDGSAWNMVEGNVMFMVDIDAGEDGGMPCEGSLDNVDDMIPSIFEVSNAYPNPFNPSTAIDINIPEAGMLNVGVYNLKGQLMSTLMNKNVYPGSYSLAWDASNLTSGLYIFSVTYGDKTYNQKVTLVK